MLVGITAAQPASVRAGARRVLQPIWLLSCERKTRVEDRDLGDVVEGCVRPYASDDGGTPVELPILTGPITVPPIPPTNRSAPPELRERKNRSQRRDQASHQAFVRVLRAGISRLMIHACLPTCRPRVNPYCSNSSTVALNRNRS